MAKKREAAEEVMECPECGGGHLVRDYNRGELVCEDCGLVLDEQLIDQGPEWRAFDADQGEKRARTGAPMTYTIHDKGLSTEIGWKNKDSYGKSIPTRNRAQLYRLRKWQRRIRVSNATERNLAFALSELDRMASELHLSQNVKENAALIYRRALKKDLIRGRSIDAFVAASLYAACRLLGVPRPLKEVSKASKRLHSEVAMTYRLLVRELQLRLPVDKPYKFIPSIAAKLEISQPTEQLAVKILRKAEENKALTGKDPRGLAAAALYMACQETKERRVQRVIARAAGTTEVTLRNRYRGLREALERLDVTPSDLAQGKA